MIDKKYFLRYYIENLKPTVMNDDFMFSLTEIGGQTSPIKITTNDETKDQVPDPCDDESDEKINLKNLFLSFKPHLNLFLRPVYYN